MKLTKDYIINHIKETKYPVWYLYVIQNYKRVPIQFYLGEDWSDNESTEGKVQKSVDRLLNALNSLPSDALLCIELKTNSKTNAASALGPFEFYNRDKTDETEAPAQLPQFPGLIGLPTAPAGYVSEETLNGRLEALRVENERKLNDYMFKHREKEFEEKMQRERQELKELRKELNDEKKKYESNTGAAAETLVFALKKIIAEFFPGLKAQATAPSAALQGVQQPETAAPNPEPDEKYKVIEELATKLYENPSVSESDIRGILQSMEQPAQVETQKAEE